MITALEPAGIGPILLDSSALLALCLHEPGGDQVERAVGASSHAYMTVTNVAESTSRLMCMGWTVPEVESAMTDLEIMVLPEDRSHGILAGELHARTRGTGLSTGDAVCLAAAVREEWPVFTSDRAWATLDLGIPVILIR